MRRFRVWFPVVGIVLAVRPSKRIGMRSRPHSFSRPSVTKSPYHRAAGAMHYRCTAHSRTSGIIHVSRPKFPSACERLFPVPPLHFWGIRRKKCLPFANTRRVQRCHFHRPLAVTALKTTYFRAGSSGHAARGNGGRESPSEGWNIRRSVVGKTVTRGAFRFRRCRDIASRSWSASRSRCSSLS